VGKAVSKLLRSDGKEKEGAGGKLRLSAVGTDRLEEDDEWTVKMLDGARVEGNRLVKLLVVVGRIGDDELDAPGMVIDEVTLTEAVDDGLLIVAEEFCGRGTRADVDENR
jgi:hypothetical protein